MTAERPIARCLSNEVEAWYFPFFIKRGQGMEPDFLLLDIHLEHMTPQELQMLGELVRISGPGDLEAMDLPRDDKGVWLVGADEEG